MAGTLELKSGDDYTLQFTFVDSDGAAVDITGKTVKFAIKNKLSDSDASAIYSTSWTSHSDAANGITTKDIADSVTAAWTPGQYKWQARVINTDNSVNSTDIGECIIEENLIDDE